MEGNKKSHLLHLCGQLLRLVLIPCHIEDEPYAWTRTTALSFAAELDGHVLGTLCAVTMALLTNRLDLCIQGLFGAGKSRSMAVLLLALVEIDDTDSLKILFICKENSGTRSFADLLLWLNPPGGVCRRIGRLVGDQERNKSSYSQTKFDIHPREGRTMLNKCQIILATGGTVAQDLTMQWSTMGGFVQELSLMVVDEGQQYGTDREIAVISLLQQQPLIIWTGDAQQTPGGIARTAPNAKRARQLLLAKKHGLRSERQYFMPATLAEAMTRLLASSSNSCLLALADILNKGQHTLGNLWTDHLQEQAKQDLTDSQTLLPGTETSFRAASQQERAQRPSLVDQELLDGTTVDFKRSLVRLAWILQHAATLLPMAGDLQAVLNSETAGVSNVHSWDFPALAYLAERGFLAPDAWNCKKLQVSLKVTIDVPMLGTIIENNGDSLDDSHMPIGWPLLIDGAVRQCCVHRYSTIQDMQDMLQAYDLEKNSVEINRSASQWSHYAVWNRKYMEARHGNKLRQLWEESEPAIGRKISPSYEIKANDIRRAVGWIVNLPPASSPESPFFRTLGTPAQQHVPPLNSTLARRAMEEWERTLCENKAVAILQQMQEGRPALIPKECEEILIAMVLDKPLGEAKDLVEDPENFFEEIVNALSEKRNHPVLMQMLQEMTSTSSATNEQATSSTSHPGSEQVPSQEQFQ